MLPVSCQGNIDISNAPNRQCLYFGMQIYPNTI